MWVVGRDTTLMHLSQMDVLRRAAASLVIECGCSPGRAGASGCISVRDGEHVMSSVSVVIPCYKYGHFLEDAVTSVLDDQEGVDVRVLIIDDASPDDSAEVARKIAARDPRVDLIVHAANMGNIATFNEGLLEWADGKYCMLLSADDRLTQGALRRARDLLDAHPEVGFVHGHSLWVMDGAPLPAARLNVRGWSVWAGQPWLERCFRQAENPVGASTLVVRTSLHKRVGGYDPQLPKAADMEIIMRLAAYADIGYLRGVDQSYYRLHEHNMSKSVTTLMELRQRRAVFEVVLDRYGERLPDIKRLSGIVHRQLGREALWASGRVYDRGRLRRTELGRRLLGAGANEPERDVDELLDFAFDCWPEVSRLLLYRNLQSRKSIGPRGMYYMLNQKARWWLRRRSWKYRGI
jgi:glycosyltransferase involved in cell wall biosynthesis